MKKSITPWDAIPAAICILLSGLLLLCPLLSKASAAENSFAVISYRDGRASETYSLSSDREIPIQCGQYSMLILIEDGKVSVAESNCPDGICIKTGKISKIGETLVCAPAGVSVKIVSTVKEGIDAFIG